MEQKPRQKPPHNRSPLPHIPRGSSLHHPTNHTSANMTEQTLNRRNVSTVVRVRILSRRRFNLARLARTLVILIKHVASRQVQAFFRQLLS
jgi:hypothetical protein